MRMLSGENIVDLTSKNPKPADNIYSMIYIYENNSFMGFKILRWYLDPHIPHGQNYL